jgi:hypothetical protein
MILQGARSRLRYRLFARDRSAVPALLFGSEQLGSICVCASRGYFSRGHAAVDPVRLKFQRRRHHRSRGDHASCRYRHPIQNSGARPYPDVAANRHAEPRERLPANGLSFRNTMIGGDNDDMRGDPDVVAYCQATMPVENGIVIERHVVTDPDMAAVSLDDSALQKLAVLADHDRSAPTDPDPGAWTNNRARSQGKPVQQGVQNGIRSQQDPTRICASKQTAAYSPTRPSQVHCQTNARFGSTLPALCTNWHPSARKCLREHLQGEADEVQA